MPNAFNFSASPFDCLSTDEQALVRSNVDIAYFQPQAVVLEVGAETTHLFVIIKGYVTQMEGDEVQATFGPDDCFDGRSLVAGRASSRFVAAEEVLVYQLARATVQELIARNATFGALLFSDLGNKLSALAQRAEEHETQSLLMARVDQAYLRPAHTVPASASIVQVAQVFKDQRTTSVLVEDPSRGAQGLGIFTATSLQHAVLDGRRWTACPWGIWPCTRWSPCRPATPLAMPWPCCCAPGSTGWWWSMKTVRCKACCGRWICSVLWPTNRTWWACKLSRRAR